MTKKLSELTLEELWQLFPIHLDIHRPEYFEWFSDEKTNILKITTEVPIYRISHIGSSAVPGLMSKNIVDILVEVHHVDYLTHVAEKLSKQGWLIMSKELGENPQISLNKGYTETGYADRVFHLHLRVKGDWAELYFRDYLIENKSVANEYEILKLELAQKFKNNRDEYTHQKAAFVKQYSEIAEETYKGRYA